MPTALVLLLLTAAAPDPRLAIRDALQRGDLRSAVDAAKPWSRTGPEALGCYAALLEASGRYQEAAQVRKQLKPAPAAAPIQPPKLGAHAYVTASSLALRASPAATAPVLVQLSLGTRVEVLEQGGAFAKVRVGMPARPVRLVEVSLSDLESPPNVLNYPGGPTEGFVAAAYLGDAPPAQADLQKAARSADPAERATALERLAAMARDRETFAQLAGAAFEAGRCGIAGHAASVVAGRVDVLGGFDVEAFELVYACRGDLREARVLRPGDKELARKKVPAHACAVGETAGAPCAFCPLEYEDENSKEALGAQKRILMELHQYESRRAALDELFTTRGPSLHVRLRRRAGALTPLAAAGARLEQESCGEGPSPEDNGLVARPLALPEVKTGEAIDLWIGVPEYAGFVYGLVPGGEAEARSGALAARNVSRTADRFTSGGRFVALELPFCCCD
jgi:hypothetical protein